MKTCTKCGKAKTHDEFHWDKRDGLTSRCKACQRARDRAYYAANREAIAQRGRVRRQANPHIGWESIYRQRARQYGFTPVVVSFTRDDLITHYGDACWYCHTGAFSELDHHVPVAAGGHHTLNNCRPSCTPCNRAKLHTTDRDHITKAKVPA